MERKSFFQLAEEFTPFVVANCDGLLFVVPTSSRGRLFWRGNAEQDTLARALAELERAGLSVGGTTLVDVGANVGTEALAALRAGIGSVLACEPHPGNFKLLHLNLVLNDAVSRVSALPVALSNRCGSGTIAVDPRDSRKTYVVSDGPVPAGLLTQTVRLTTLDELVAEANVDPDRIGLLWLDVEGLEARVLDGARATLAHGIPLVLELYPRLLDRAGGLRSLPRLIDEHYECILDLRDQTAVAVSANRVGDLVETYRRAGDYTDILAFTPFTPCEAAGP